MDIKNIIVSAVTAIVVVVVASVLVGNQGVGAGTRFPNGLSADGTAPSSGEVRGTTFTATGAVDFNGALDVAGVISSGGEGTQLGSSNSTNYLYIGAGDGCAAVYFAASTTQTVQATSTSFCYN